MALTPEEQRLADLKNPLKPGSIGAVLKIHPDENKLDKKKTSGREHRSLLTRIIDDIVDWVNSLMSKKADLVDGRLPANQLTLYVPADAAYMLTTPGTGLEYKPAMDFLIAKQKVIDQMLFDLTPPEVLSLVSITEITTTTALLGITISEEGRVFWGVWPAATTQRSKTDIQDGLGAVWSSNKGLFAGDEGTSLAFGLTPGIAYKVHSFVRDNANNDSVPTMTGVFTTMASAGSNPVQATLSGGTTQFTGSSDGKIVISGVSGGTGPYSYSTTQAGAYTAIDSFPVEIAGYPAGTASVWIKDSTSTPAVEFQVNIPQPALVAATGTVTVTVPPSTTVPATATAGEIKTIRVAWTSSAGTEQVTARELEFNNVNDGVAGDDWQPYIGSLAASGTSDWAEIDDTVQMRLKITTNNGVRYSPVNANSTITFAAAPTYNRTLTNGQDADGVTVALAGGYEFKFNAPATGAGVAPASLLLFDGATQIGSIDFITGYTGQTFGVREIATNITYHKVFTADANINIKS